MINVYIYTQGGKQFHVNDFVEYELFDTEIILRRRGGIREPVQEQIVFYYDTEEEALVAWNKFHAALQHSIKTGLKTCICMQKNQRYIFETYNNKE